jgi:hypothetical protein
MARSGPITYLVMEDQFPSVPRLAGAWHRLRACPARSACMSEHRAATAPAVTRGNDVSFRPGQPAYRRQVRAPASAAARGRGPGAALPGPGAVPHPPLARAPCPGRSPRPGPGGIRYAARHQAIAWLPFPGHRAVGMMPARPSPAPPPPWPGSGGTAPGIPGAAGIAWRDWRWRAAGASCGQPLVPTGPQSRASVFSNHTVLAGAPLRNRTVDLLLTIWRHRGRCRPLAQVSGSYRVVRRLVSAGAVAALWCCTTFGAFERETRSVVRYHFVAGE